MGITLRKSEVLRYLGYSGQQMTPALEQRVDGVIARCEAEQTPHFYWEAYGIEPVEDEAERPAFAVRGTTLVFRGSDIVDYLHGATACALLACTLGMESERQLQRLVAVNPTDALIYDAACTELVERGGDQVEAQIVAYAHERGLFSNHRYSPGYGDFDLAIQPTFVDVLQGQKRLGLMVTEDNLLVPAKSITAVVGFYPKRPKAAKLGCGNCNCREWCTIRASGNRCFGGRAGATDAIEGEDAVSNDAAGE